MSEVVRALTREAIRLGTDVYAVIDGVQFEDLPNRLASLGLEARPLYIGETPLLEAKAGPQLVRVEDSVKAKGLAAMSRGVPAMVWWLWPTGDDSIYKHLRRLGMIEVPGLPVHGSGATDTVTQILFRHADPRVLAVTLPELDEAQMDFFMGHSPCVIFQEPQHEVSIVRHRPKTLS